MHGGSGVSEKDYFEVIKRGVRKVNYYTYMAKAGADAVSNKEYKQFHDVVIDAKKAMCENVKNAIKVFSNL
jgi:fructose-bisphosphate aldolase class II